MGNEAATRARYITPGLQAAGWDTMPHSLIEEKAIVQHRTGRDRKPRRPDYTLYYTDVPVAVVEAKADHKLPGDGLQQAKRYAEKLGVRFAYSTNGKGIIEFDYTTGLERELTAFPTPDQLWARLQTAMTTQHRRQD